jgi:hypothetical protein
MGLLLLFFGGVAKDVLAATLFLRRRQNIKADETVRRWKWRRKIPFVNWYLKRKAGKPANFMERKRNSAIVGAARALINTETFEHIVGAALNSRSKLKIKMPDSLKTSKSGASRRHWGRVTIIS